MRNKRFIIALTGALIFGLIATISILRYVSTAQAYTKSLGNVVVAKFPIQLGAKINAEQLALAQIPNGSTPEGAYNEIEKVVGRVAITNINVREPLTSYKLAVEGAAGGLSAVIPEGYRAMTVKVDDVVGISGFVMPGAFVDVVAVITPADQASNNNPVSKIVLQNIKVLANGQNIDQPKDGRETTSVKAVTLQVTPEQAERLALATNEGKLQLVMRNFGDQDASQTPGVNKRTLLTGEAYSYEPPSPARNEAPKLVTPAVTSSPRIIYEPAPQVREPRRVAVPVAPVAPPPVARRPAVELIEGTKKSSVEFP